MFKILLDAASSFDGSPDCAEATAALRAVAEEVRLNAQAMKIRLDALRVAIERHDFDPRRLH